MFAASAEGEAEYERADFAAAARLFHGGANQLDETAFAIFLEGEIAHALFFQHHQLGFKLHNALAKLPAVCVVKKPAKPRLGLEQFALFAEEHEEGCSDRLGLLAAIDAHCVAGGGRNIHRGRAGGARQVAGALDAGGEAAQLVGNAPAGLGHGAVINLLHGARLFFQRGAQG